MLARAASAELESNPIHAAAEAARERVKCQSNSTWTTLQYKLASGLPRFCLRFPPRCTKRFCLLFPPRSFVLFVSARLLCGSGQRILKNSFPQVLPVGKSTPFHLA